MNKLAILAAAAMLAASPFAAAHAGDGRVIEAQAQQSFTNAELQSFVVAAIEIRQIGQRMMPQMEQAANEDEAAAIQEQGMSAMRSAVEDAGLSVERYREIAQAAKDSPDLRERLTGIAETMQPPAGDG